MLNLKKKLMKYWYKALILFSYAKKINNAFLSSKMHFNLFALNKKDHNKSKN